MEHSELLDAVRRPLSPDTQIEIPASRSEYENVQEILEEEGSKFPKLQYDGARKVAILSAIPTPLHGEMVGQLLSKIADEVKMMPGLDAGTKRHLSSTHDMRKTKNTETWDGALRYLTREETGPAHTLMIAVEVGLSQTFASLRAAISFSVCALHCRVGIAMSINEVGRGKRPSTQCYATLEEKRVAIQNAEHVLRVQLLSNPFGPLKMGEDTWFGKVATVVLETYRLEDETSPPGTLLNPTQSFVIPANLAELTLGDCIPTHILSGNNIAATPINFFHHDWFQDSFGSAMLETAMERVEDKREVQRV
ncbi:hypothetical protein V1506DRAFT_555597 [Lipomyces tetrasporus]